EVNLGVWLAEHRSPRSNAYLPRSMRAACTMTLDETGLVMRCHLDMRFALAVIMFAACDAPLPVATTPPPTPPAAPLPPDAAIAAAGSAEVMATIARTPCY